ncbi:MAG: DUF5615 family PIN-like protein [Candidatus Dormibacteria bacterium]
MVNENAGTIHLLLDEMLDPEIAVQLRRRGHDVEAVSEDNSLKRMPDADLLRYARSVERILVTDNVGDFDEHHRQFLANGERHAGMILAPSRQFPRSKRTIGLWVDALDAYLMQGPTLATMTNCRDYLRHAI